MRAVQSRIATLALLSAAVCLAARLLTPADLTAFPEMSECALSPDGRTVAVVTGRGNIALYPGGRLLTPGDFKDSSLRWSPDGSRIAFFSTRPEADLWIAEVSSGRLTPVTKVVHSNFWLPGRGSGLAWSPDAQRLAFVGADPSIPAPTTDPRVITRLQFKSRTDFSDDRREHIWLVDAAANAKPRLLTTGSFHEHSIDWHGNQIVFVSNRRGNPDAVHNYDLFLVDTGSGSIRRLTDTPGCEYTPVFSPDGRFIAYTATTRAVTTIDSVAEDTHVWVIPSSGGQPREWSRAFDRRSTSPRWSPDGRSVYFLAGDRGRQLLYRDGQPVFDKNVTISAFSPGPQLAYLMGDALTLASSTWATPASPTTTGSWPACVLSSPSGSNTRALTARRSKVGSCPPPTGVWTPGTRSCSAFTAGLTACTAIRWPATSVSRCLPPAATPSSTSIPEAPRATARNFPTAASMTGEVATTRTSWRGSITYSSASSGWTAIAWACWVAATAAT